MGVCLALTREACYTMTLMKYHWGLWCSARALVIRYNFSFPTVAKEQLSWKDGLMGAPGALELKHWGIFFGGVSRNDCWLKLLLKLSLEKGSNITSCENAEKRKLFSYKRDVLSGALLIFTKLKITKHLGIQCYVFTRLRYKEFPDMGLCHKNAIKPNLT